MGTPMNDLFTSVKKQLGTIISGNRKILEKVEEINVKYTDGNSSSYRLGYEQGLKEGRIEALHQKYTPNEIREIIGLPRVEQSKNIKESEPLCDFQLESNSISAILPSLYKMICEDISKEGYKSGQTKINMSVYRCLYHLENRILELNRRTEGESNG